MIESITNDSLEKSLYRNLYAAKQKATDTGKPQLIFSNITPLYIGNRIINEQCVFLHPDGRITCIENRERALEMISDYKGELYLPEQIVREETYLENEA